MPILTGFADEISKDLDVQLDVLESEGIQYLDLRSVWDKNVIQLTKEELLFVKKELTSRGFRVSSIASPIGKSSIRNDFAPHLKEFEQVIKLAKQFNTPYIRIFSFFIPVEDDPSQYREEVISRMKELVKKAEEAGVILLHENEKHIYGDTAERCLDLLKTCQSPNFRAVFDPANFVQCHLKPFTEAYPLLQPYMEYVHIKDAHLSDGKVVPAGDGDGEIEELLNELKRHDYSGFLSLEPHLAAEGVFSGFSGPALFKQAAQSLKKIQSKVYSDKEGLK